MPHPTSSNWRALPWSASFPRWSDDERGAGRRAGPPAAVAAASATAAGGLVSFPARSLPHTHSALAPPVLRYPATAPPSTGGTHMSAQLDLYDSRLSYVHGASDVPLIGATIGDVFDRVVAQLPEHEALVSR